MFTDTTLFVINASSIFFLVTLLIILAAATRMKGGAVWAALIIVATTVPAYVSNFSRDFLPDYFVASTCFVMSLNLLCMPALYLFTRSQLDKSFHLTARSLLHGIPALISFVTTIVYFAHLSPEQIEADRIFMKEGGEHLPAIVNDILLFGLFFVYYFFIFRHIRRRKKELQDNFSDSDYIEIAWVQRFQILFFALFFIVAIAYAIEPRTDIWLIPILNSIAMAYLVYIVIYHSTAPYLNRLQQTEIAAKTPAPVAMTTEQMHEICDRITHYLQESQTYKNSDFTLATLAHKTGIQSNNISTAINAHLKKNFFEMVNTMRIQEAKHLLENLDANRSIDSIYTECGFRSRSSFFATFKKIEGVTPAQWLKSTVDA
jgi:AraC-like DNA-binding protein